MESGKMSSAAGRGKKFGFKPALRIRKTSEYDRVFSEGRRINSTGALVLIAKNGLSHARLGVVAGKKLGGAVTRNRIKRVFREAFRLDRHGLPSGVDLVVIPRPRRTQWTLEAAREALKAAWVKA